MTWPAASAAARARWPATRRTTWRSWARSRSAAAGRWPGCGSSRTATTEDPAAPGIPAAALPAVRRRALRAGLPGLRLRAQRGGPQRPGLQPLHRHAVLLEQLPVQGAAVQLVDTQWEKPLDWQLNPEVTVRCRGVMEKCTFCIQRIREAELRPSAKAGRCGTAKSSRRARRRARRGRSSSATCSTRHSEVSKLTRGDPRRYHVLEELNTKPAVTYLRRIRRDA